MRQNNNHISFFYLLVILIPPIFISACNNSAPDKKNEDVEQTAPVDKQVTYQKPPASSNDTLIITANTAVFYTADQAQKEKIKALIPSNDFETEDHNCFYQARNARAEIKKYWSWVHIKETSTNRYLLFIKTDKTTKCIDLSSNAEMCGLFLFDGKKDPGPADMMNIGTALGFYFKK